MFCDVTAKKCLSVLNNKFIWFSNIKFLDGSLLFYSHKQNNVRSYVLVVVSSGGVPTPAGTSVFTKHNWDMGMGYLWLNGWGIYHLTGGAFMAYWVGHL